MSLLTRSPLCVRDVDLFRRFEHLDVGISIPTDREDVRRLLEPCAPPIPARVEALRALRREGIRAYAFVGPLLPMDPARLADLLGDAACEVLVDRLNYADRVKGLYRRAGLEEYLGDAWFERCAAELRRRLEGDGIAVSVLF